jgi:RHS repeat-associated protein
MKKSGKWMRMVAVILTLTMVMNLLPMSAIAEAVAEEQAQWAQQEEPPEGEDEGWQESPIAAEEEERREESVKHFLLENRSYLAAVYDEPVHYEKDGEWREIDNTLGLEVDEGEQVYTNADSDVDVKIAKRSDAEALVRIESDGYALSWKMLPQPEGEQEETDEAAADGGLQMEPSGAVSANGIQGGAQAAGRPVSEFVVEGPAPKAQLMSLEEASPETPEEIAAYNREKMAVEKVSSGGKYPEILPNVDLEYALHSKTVKENIILKDVSAAGNVFSFAVSHPGLSTRLEEDGSVTLFAEDAPDEAVYTFAPPYMYDAAGEESAAVRYQLVPGEDAEHSVLTVEPDRDWLRAEERAYPVVLDPYTQTSKKVADITDTYVASERKDEAISTNGSFLVGYSPSTGEGACKALIKFNTLPTLKPGDIIVQAKLDIYQYMYSGITPSIEIRAHQVQAAWNKNVTWNTRPAYDSTVLDYAKVTQNQVGSNLELRRVEFDVTKLVRGWYNTGVNNGVLLDSDAEQNKTVTIARFFTSNYPDVLPNIDNTSLFPVGTFYYKSATGLEGYYSYHTQNLGRAGTGSTNDFNGNLVYVHNDAATSGGRMPASLSHVYNLSTSDTASVMGYGWKLDMQQLMAGTGNNDYPMYYEDGDGTRHYFVKTNEVGKYDDEDGLGMKYTHFESDTGSSSNTKHTVELKDGSTMIFDFYANLRSIEDLNGNKVQYNYAQDKREDHIPSELVDAAGNKITLVYNSDYSRLTGVKDQFGRTTSYGYDSAGNLTTITYPDGTKTTFSYSGHKLTKVTGADGYSVEYSYTTDMRVPRVSKIVEKGGTTTGQSLQISYKNGCTTVFEDCGLDGDLATKADNLTTTYHFDTFGRPSSVYDQDGNANSYKFYTEGKVNNRLKTSGSLSPTSQNPLDDPGFDASLWTDEWHAVKTVPTGAHSEVTRIQTDGHLGGTCLELDKWTTEGKCLVYQDVMLNAGTYTFSGYVRQSNVVTAPGAGSNAGFGLGVDVGGVTHWSRFLTGTKDMSIDNGWTRLSVTFTLPVKQSVRIRAGLESAKGTVNVDSFQVDKGEVPQKFNMVKNAGFEAGSSTPAYWTMTNTTSGQDGNRTDDKHWGSYGLKLTGETNKEKIVRQLVKVTGQEGDVFKLSGWANAKARPGGFKMNVAVIYSTGSPRWFDYVFDPNVEGWQYTSGIVPTDDGNPSTNRTYTGIEITIIYSGQCNPAWFDDIQLVKDDAQSYVYDGEGNLTNAASAAEKSGFTYDKDENLSKLNNPTGSSFEYGYDVKKNLVLAQGTEGLQYRYEYDSYGNPVKSTVTSERGSAAVTPGRTYYIRQQMSGKYLDLADASAPNGTDVVQKTYTGGASQQWKVVDAGGGYVKLVTQAGGKTRVLDVLNAGTADRTNVRLADDVNGDGQKFKLRAKSDGSLEITAKCAGDKSSLDNRDLTDSGISIYIMTNKNEHAARRWYFEEVTGAGDLSDTMEVGKTYRLRSRGSGQYLEVLDNHTGDGGRLGQNYYTGAENQMFTIEDLGGGYQALRPVSAPDKRVMLCRDMDGGYCPLMLGAPGTSNDQSFKFIANGNGTYRIAPKVEETSCITIRLNPFMTRSQAYIVFYSNVESKQWILEEVKGKMTSELEYTKNGSLVSKTTDARGNSTSTTYNSYDLPQTVTDAKGNQTTYTYNTQNDHLLSVTSGNASVSYTYDKDRLVKINHNGFDYSFTYDAFGNTTQTKAGSRTLSTNEYMPHNGLLSKVTYGNGNTVSYGYDKYGRLIEQKHGTTTAFKNQYDGMGNLYRHQDLVNNVTYEYNYDLIGRLLGVTASNDQSQQFRYDSKNRLQSYTNKIAGQSTTAEYVYGNVATNAQQSPDLIYGVKVNGSNILSYAYDDMARLKTRTLNTTTPFVTSVEYLEGAAGNTTALVKSITNGSDKIEYTYDANGNIETVTENGKLIAKYYYDELNQLVRVDDALRPYTFVYVYDDGGNLLRKEFYSYTNGELGNRQISLEWRYGDGAWKDLLTYYNGSTITYDAIGNPLTYRNNMKFTWQNGRQLATVQYGSKNMSYKYNTEGIRTEKTVNGETTKYYLNGSSVVTQITGSDRMDFTYDEKGSLLGLTYNGAQYYYVKNALGDIIGILDAAGTQVVTYTYDAWGASNGMSGSMMNTLGKQNPFRYRGYFYDDETGFYYLNSRYYDPTTGRFINADGAMGIVGNDLSHNMFAYCFNNPVNLADPSGYIAGVDDAALLLLWILAGVALTGTAVVASTLPPIDGNNALQWDYPEVFQPKIIELFPEPKPEPPKEPPKKSPENISEPYINPQPWLQVALDKNKRPNNAIFYPATLNKPGITVNTRIPMDADQARLYVLKKGNVWTKNSYDAIIFCDYISGGFVSAYNEKGVREGKNAFHYHLKDRYLGVHIFFDYQAVRFS